MMWPKIKYTENTAIRWASLLTSVLLIIGTSEAKPRLHHNEEISESITQETSKNWEVFISYRRSLSKHLARLVKVLLNQSNISVFLDVDSLQAGRWDDQIIRAIQEIPNFVVILSNGTLDRTIGDTNYTDVLHQEIRAAVRHNRNIIPIFDDFTRPHVDFSPEITEMLRFQGVEWNHTLVNATIQRVISYLSSSEGRTDVDSSPLILQNLRKM